MKQMLSSSVLAATVLAGANAALAEVRAEVINFGTGDGHCDITIPEGAVPGVPGGKYVGPATFVGTSSGEVNVQCTAVLVAGSEVKDSAVRLASIPFSTHVGDAFCDITLTPSGHALVKCKD